MKYFKEVKRGIRLELEPVTENEIDQALSRFAELNEIQARILELQSRKKELIAGCDHLVKYDEGGYIYDIRYCAGCGDTSLV